MYAAAIAAACTITHKASGSSLSERVTAVTQGSLLRLHGTAGNSDATPFQGRVLTLHSSRVGQSRKHPSVVSKSNIPCLSNRSSDTLLPCHGCDTTMTTRERGSLRSYIYKPPPPPPHLCSVIHAHLRTHEALCMRTHTNIDICFHGSCRLHVS